MPFLSSTEVGAGFPARVPCLRFADSGAVRGGVIFSCVGISVPGLVYPLSSSASISKSGDAIDFSPWSLDLSCSLLRAALRIADQVIEADRHCLPQVHGDILFAGRNPISQWQWLRSSLDRPNFSDPNKQRHRACRSTVCESRLAPLPIGEKDAAACGGAPRWSPPPACSRPLASATLPNSCASVHHRGCAHGGNRLAKRHFVGIDDAQMRESEIAHGAGGGADVERIAR